MPYKDPICKKLRDNRITGYNIKSTLLFSKIFHYGPNDNKMIYICKITPDTIFFNFGVKNNVI